MKRSTVTIGVLAVLLAGCGGGNSNPDGSDGNNCPDMAGLWSFNYSCAMSTSGRNADVTQDGCTITSVWKDDRTSDEDILTGTVDADGHTTVTIGLDEGDVTCTGVLSGNTWTSSCTPDDCQLEAEKL